MSKPVYKVCGTKMMRNGTASAGTQRWRCGACGSSSVRHIGSSVKWLDTLLRWLLGKASQAGLGMAARTFMKRTSAFWSLWPILPICDEIHHVVYMDGLRVARKCVDLIACTDEHEPLRRARRGLGRLCREGTLFAYLGEGLLRDGTIPTTSNGIESMNAQVKAMLRNHRGRNVGHRVKAVLWWRHMHSEAPLPAARMLKELPADKAIREWRRMAARADGDDTGAPARWGEGLAWSEFHHSTPYPFAIE